MGEERPGSQRKPGVEQQIFTQVLILLAVAVLVVLAFRRLALPPVLGYIVVGLLLGPFTLGLVTAEDKALLAEIGVVFLLFMLGLEFSLARMLAMKWEVFGLGGLQVVVTTLVFGLAGWWLGLDPAVAVVVGGALALSSTALVIKQLADQLEINRSHGRLATGILLFQDLAAVPFLMLIPMLGRREPGYSASDVLLALGEGVLVVVVVLVTGRWLLRPLFHEIARGRIAELFTLAVLLVSLGSAWITHAAGLSLALGAFLAGMMLSETEYRHQIEADIRPFRDIFLGLFFVTVGMRLDPRTLVDQIEVVALVVFALIVGKVLLVTPFARRYAHDWREAARTALAVAQGGEFGLALVSVAVGEAVLGARLAQPLLAGLVVSMLASPFVIRHNGRLTEWLRAGPDPYAPDGDTDEPAIRAVAERDHVIICGYGRVGQNVARILEGEGFEFVALDLDPERVRRARQAGDPVFFGDAAKPEILQCVGLAHASVVVIAFSDPLYANRIIDACRRLRGEVPVLVRTRDDTHLELLQQTGATTVVPESMESSLILAAHVLTLLKVPLPRIIRRVEDIRAHRYGLLRSVFPKEAARPLDETHSLRERLATVVLPAGAWAVGRRLGELPLAEAQVMVNAIRRDGITGRDPLPGTELKEGDVVVLYGTPEALEHAEVLLLNG